MSSSRSLLTVCVLLGPASNATVHTQDYRDVPTLGQPGQLHRSGGLRCTQTPNKVKTVEEQSLG